MKFLVLESNPNNLKNFANSRTTRLRLLVVKKKYPQYQNIYYSFFLVLTLSPKRGKDQEFNLLHPPVVERFFFGRCPINLNDNNSSGLKACSGCNSICYSTREAQKGDWKRHKTICKALQPLGMEIYNLHVIGYNNRWQQSRF